LAAEGCEVELPEGVCAVRDVIDDLADEGRATVVGARPAQGYEIDGPDEPLLDDQAQDQGGLAVRPGPLRGSDGCNGRSHPRTSGGPDVRAARRADLVDADPAHVAATVRLVVEGHVDHLLVEPGQPGGLQCRHPVKGG
jgi:hypothetical protein